MLVPTHSTSFIRVWRKSNKLGAQSTYRGPSHTHHRLHLNVIRDQIWTGPKTIIPPLKGLPYDTLYTSTLHALTHSTCLTRLRRKDGNISMQSIHCDTSHTYRYLHKTNGCIWKEPKPAFNMLLSHTYTPQSTQDVEIFGQN